MSIFTRLFKPRAVETTDDKIANLKHMDQEKLKETIARKEDDAVRTAAVSHLKYGEYLLGLAVDDPAPGVQTAARKRLGELLDKGEASLRTLEAKVSDQSTLLTLCGFSTNASVALVEQTQDETLLGAIAESGSTTQLRQTAARKLQSRAQLETSLKSAKTKDKAVYKIIKSKLEVFKEEKAREQLARQQAESLCNQAEQLSKRQVDDIFHTRLGQIESAWQNHSTLLRDDEVKARFETAMTACQQKIAAAQAAEQAEQARLENERLAKKELHGAIHEVSEFIARVLAQPQPDLQQETKVLERLVDQQNQALDDAKASGLDVTEEQRRAENHASAAQTLLKHIENHGPLGQLMEQLEASPEQGGTIERQMQSLLTTTKQLRDEQIPDIVTSARASLRQWSESVRQRSELSRQRLKEAGELVRKGRWSVDKGYVGRSRAILRDLEEKLQEIKSHQSLPTHLEGKYENLKEAIHKLGDWHSFAVTPKKHKLITDMKALVNSDIHPTERAKKVQALQDAWRELSRGGQGQDEDLWQEFQLAGQQAFEPCKAYFEAQAQQREDNAAQRETLIAQMRQYDREYDWDNADWKEVDKTLKMAREAWQNCWPVPRAQVKPLQAAFDGIMDNLFARLHAHYDANQKKKQTIVDQAAQLEQLNDINAAIDKAKQLQAQWQTIGRCKRKEDQALWRAFRQHCDAVFEKRQLENDALRQEREAALGQAQNLLGEMEAVLKLKGDDLFARRGKFDELNQQLQSVGELPREHRENISRRHQSVLEAIDKKIQQERDAAQSAVWHEVFQCADLLRRYELTCLTDGADNTLLTQFEQNFAEAGRWPGNTGELLQTRLQAAQAENFATELGATAMGEHEERIKQLRMLCIRSEIANGTDSPEDDKSLRMAYQVSLLQQGLGQIEQPDYDTMSDVIAQWLQVPAVEDAPYKALQKRLQQTWRLI